MKIILAEWGNYSLNRKSQNPHNRNNGLYTLLKSIMTNPTSIQFELILIINKGCFNGEYDYLKITFPFISKIVYRKSNRGFDFGAYNYGYQLLKQQSYSGEVVFMNSTAIVSRDQWLEKYLALLNSDDGVGLCGATYNGLAFDNMKSYHHRQFYLHGYFLLTKMEYLQYIFPNKLTGYTCTNKLNVIKFGEVKISQAFLENGYRLKAMQHQMSYKKNEPWIWGNQNFPVQSFLNSRYKI